MTHQPYFDTDHYISKLHPNSTIAEIFTLVGEKSFRELEGRALMEAKKIKPSIISIGGGTLSTLNNISIVKTLGTIIHIQQPFDIINKRISQPKYINNNSLRDVYDQRMLSYKRLAHYSINIPISQKPSQTAKNLLKMISIT